MDEPGDTYFYCQTDVDGMPEDKIRVSARIPKDLYDICLQRYDNITNAINAGLELLRVQGEDKNQISEDICRQGEDRSRTSEDGSSRESAIQELKAMVEGKDARIKELQEQIKVNDGHQQNRIEDLKSHIYSLDNQMRTKDDQIEKLNENMHKQAVHLQTLLNQKAIEAPGAKKPFWKFW